MRLALPGRRRKKQFERAADGSMTLMEHLYELRDRLFKACLAVLAGMIGGWFLAGPVQKLLQQPYMDYCTSHQAKQIAANGGVLPDNAKACEFLVLGVGDPLLLQLKITMWVGLIIAAPLWMYQLWAFIAPGLHRHERRWTYAFAAAAAPLFALGAVLAYFVVAFGLEFLLQFAGDNTGNAIELLRYIDFVTGMMLVFGVAFEFPLGILLLNVAGVVGAKKLLSWWRVIVFAFFVFAAVATPTGDPFGMTAFALALSGLYFGAVGLAFLNDRRRARKRAEEYGNVGDDEISPLEFDSASVDEVDPVAQPEAVTASGPVTASGAITASEPITASGAIGTDTIDAPRPLDRRYDDVT
ncbi:twin-arginine translocase subunit TatC [Virgisporangium ochraceum]|uniref:Sec-independent protein translocase protein TatC n=2 Tax=Virgisporangium ochraceum TaxID=65505 RepID=A0A8J4A1E5_9ACTN|nr:Sec-independent protein translocase protein TatC [Virgisporangium ochraceum]